MRYFFILCLFCLQACSDRDTVEYFCESRQSQQWNGFIRQYIVQLNARQICVTWSPGSPYCGVFGEDTVSSESVNKVTGLRTELRYRAKLLTDTVELEIIRKEITPNSKAIGELSQDVVSTLRFSKEMMKLISISGQGEAEPVVYTCSAWKKKPWWQIF